MKAFLIAAPASGSGKTVVTAVLLRQLVSAGYRVASFKSGPDYIDPKFHSFITEAPCCNLDSWMHTPETVRHLFARRTRSADVAVIEGAMGLFDGARPHGEGSAAQLARELDIPVVLVINARGQAQSIAALVYGFTHYDPSVNIAGVICNNVASEHHYSLLKESIPIPVLGALFRNGRYTLENRHLGLIPVEEQTDIAAQLQQMAAEAAGYLSAESILNKLPHYELPQAGTLRVDADIKEYAAGKRIALAQDRAFHFYYEDNLALLRDAGAELIPFSVCDDTVLPDNCDALYIGGGFPEVFAAEIAENRSMRLDIYSKLTQGLPCYAECGGLMLLTQSLETVAGDCYPMTGFFNADTVMTRRLQRFGYVTVAIGGHSVRAHEFHHSLLREYDAPDYTHCYTVAKQSANSSWTCGLHKKRTLAGYAHIHFYANPAILKLFLSRVSS